jgi:hypothetical protein
VLKTVPQDVNDEQRFNGFPAIEKDQFETNDRGMHLLPATCTFQSHRKVNAGNREQNL